MSTRTFTPLAFPAAAGEVSAQPAAGGSGRSSLADLAPVEATPLTFPTLPSTESGEAMERARVQGHAAGYAAGRRAATATLEADRAALRADAERELLQLRTAVEAVRVAAGVLNARTAFALDAAEDAVLAAAVEIATVILGREPMDTEQSALAAVRRALDAAGPLPVHAVRLHPADLALVQEAVAGEPGVRFLGDPAVSRGDALAEVPDGVVDAGIASALVRVRLALAGTAS